jgi:hypothetical protein
MASFRVVTKNITGRVPSSDQYLHDQHKLDPETERMKISENFGS